jgi:hypothetical protein
LLCLEQELGDAAPRGALPSSSCNDPSRPGLKPACCACLLCQARPLLPARQGRKPTPKTAAASSPVQRRKPLQGCSYADAAFGLAQSADAHHVRWVWRAVLRAWRAACARSCGSPPISQARPALQALRAAILSAGAMATSSAASGGGGESTLTAISSGQPGARATPACSRLSGWSTDGAGRRLTRSARRCCGTRSVGGGRSSHAL